jgi:hypothetical protein
MLNPNEAAPKYFMLFRADSKKRKDENGCQRLFRSRAFLDDRKEIAGNCQLPVPNFEKNVLCCLVFQDYGTQWGYFGH